jgi:hypothetical protein
VAKYAIVEPATRYIRRVTDRDDRTPHERDVQHLEVYPVDEGFHLGDGPWALHRDGRRRVKLTPEELRAGQHPTFAVLAANRVVIKTVQDPAYLTEVERAHGHTAEMMPSVLLDALPRGPDGDVAAGWQVGKKLSADGAALEDATPEEEDEATRIPHAPAHQAVVDALKAVAGYEVDPNRDQWQVMREIHAHHRALAEALLPHYDQHQRWR